MPVYAHTTPLRVTFLNLFLAALLLTVLTDLGYSQGASATDGSTPSGLAPGAGSYALSDFDSVNLFNGNLNVSLPLMGVGGRGAASMTMTLSLNSKRWRVVDLSNELTQSIVPDPDWWTGLKPGYGPGVLQGRWGGVALQSCSIRDPSFPDNPVFVNERIRKYNFTTLTFTAGDGTEYELRDSGTGGQPLLSVSCPSLPGLSYSQGANRGKVFSSTDGSAVTFISDSDIYDNVTLNNEGAPFTVSGHLMLRDGTRYRIDGGNVTWIRDRNGNKLSFTYDASRRPIAITDSLNRVVTIAYDVQDVAPYGLCDRITWKGSGGAQRVLRISKASLGNALRADLTLKSFKELFPELDGGFGLYNPTVVSALWLPDNRSYQFRYNSYAELARIVLPTGGAVEYDMVPGSGVIGLQIYRRVWKRRILPDGITVASETTWNATQSSATDPSPWLTTVSVEQRDSAGALLAQNINYFRGSAPASLTQPSRNRHYIYPDWDEGLEIQTDTLNAAGAVQNRTNNSWQQRASVSWWSGWVSTWNLNAAREPANDPRLTATTISMMDVSPNLVAKNTFNYDQYNNQTDVYEYDFGAGAPGALIRHAYTPRLTTNGNQGNVDYATDVNIHIRDLPIQQIVYDASENLRLQTDFIYDYYGDFPLVDCPSIVQHDGGFHAGYGARGNLTGVVLRNPGGNPSEIHLRNQYDVAGNLVKAVDGRGFATDFDFSDRFGSPDDEARLNAGAPELAGGFSYAFPTRVTNVLGHTAYAQYDYYLGLPVNSENSNGIVSSAAYNDALDRPTQRIQTRWKVDSGVPAERRQMTLTYDDANQVITTSSDRDAFNDNILTAKSYYDGLGRTWRSAAYEGSAWAITDTQFDAHGRVSQVSNPYRAVDPGSASPPSGAWTKAIYDLLGRVVDVETPDGAHVITQYGGNQVTVTDQAGKRRRRETDALGRLIKVTEGPGELNYETNYSYDALGNLLLVTQGSQTRTFAYDSLSRLISATNPESGPVTYAYDPNGNLVEKIDARGVRTTMTYDALNRVKSKVYSGITPEGTAVANLTPPVHYFCDDYATLPSGAPKWPGTPSKGRLIGVTYGSGSEGTYYKYDAAGRIVTNHQRQGISNYATTYTYNLAGGLTREHRGNRSRNLWTYDDAGRLSSMQTSFNPFLSFVYLVKDISYTSFGGLQSETYGNGLIHSMDYNNRLQPTEIMLGRPDNRESVFRINYIFGTAHNVNGQDPEIALVHNNGNIARIKYFISGTLQYSQTFQYDPLNRLRYAVEHNNGTYNDEARAWYQTFDYDRYGNRGINIANTSDNADAANSALQLADFSEANNRITRADFVYDAAGNLVAEPGKSYTYDGENKIVTATVVGGGTSQYVYDGNGYRVKKIIGGVATRFEYGAGGELIAERKESNGAVTKEYFYAGGELLATTTTGTTYEYVTADHLGSPRAWTDGSGNLVTGGRHDYLPFGEELFAGYGVRTTGQGYATNTQADGQRRQFTGYERDGETGLDFAQARYYSSLHGRFGSVDPYEPRVSVPQPQNWNRYTYVQNNPLSYVDRDGKILFNVIAGIAGGIGGGLIGGGIEIAKQLIVDRRITNLQKVGAKALNGAIFGAVTGATLGVGAGYAAAALAGAGVAAGIAERAVDGDPATDPFSAGNIVIDGIAGGVGGYYGSKALSAARDANYAAREAAYGAFEATSEFFLSQKKDALNAALKAFGYRPGMAGYLRTAAAGVYTFQEGLRGKIVRAGLRFGIGYGAQQGFNQLQILYRNYERRKDVDCDNPRNRCRTDVQVLPLEYGQSTHDNGGRRPVKVHRQ